MRHKLSGRQLSRNSPHRHAMLRNMAASLLRHETIRTTLPKAKELRRIVEPLITLAKTDSEARRRVALSRLRDQDVVTKLFGDLGPRFKARPGGYTRILHMLPRAGDSAPMALMQLVEGPVATGQTSTEPAAASGKSARGKTPKQSAQPSAGSEAPKRKRKAAAASAAGYELSAAAAPRAKKRHLPTDFVGAACKCARQPRCSRPLTAPRHSLKCSRDSIESPLRDLFRAHELARIQYRFGLLTYLLGIHQ